ncbi:hypothetical protein BH10ACI2_BH10ACI2_18660 [soil metagenome]
MLKAISLIFAIACTSTAVSAQSGKLYFGKLDKLVPDMVHIYQRLYPVVTDRDKPKISALVEKGSVASSGDLLDWRIKAFRSKILLIEPPSDAPYILIDVNGNGIFEAKERFQLSASGEPDNFQALLNLPLDNVLFKTFPVFFIYKRGAKHPAIKNGERLILQSAGAIAEGHVKIEGRDTLFQYPFEIYQNGISTTEGLFGVDVNGDGKIRNEQFSPETSFASDSELAFPLGNIYVSTAKIDLVSNRIVVRQRNKADYKRIDLEIGKEMPDFDFTDFEGKERKLSDFRGKHVMVDFWGVWCGDCTRETPFHLAAYDRFKGRGFEILGLNTDEKIDLARLYLAKNKITWPQAQKASIIKLADISYCIQEYPSTVLLGPDGKVLVLDQKELQGDNLSKTLDEILPK